MTEQYPSRLLDRFVLRMPDGLRDRLSEVAKARKRSMNAEMIAALEAWLSADQSVAPHAGLSTEENDALSKVVLEAVTSALATAPGSPAWDGFRKMLLSTGQFALLDEDGQPVRPDDRLADKGEVEGGEPYPRRIEAPTSPEVQAERDRRIEKSRAGERRREEARKKAENA